LVYADRVTAQAPTRAANAVEPREAPMLEEFRKFAMRGNVVDLAVGVVIGAAFGAIVTSLVGDIIMPIIGALTGGLDFSNYFIPLSAKVTAAALADAKKQGAVLAWGNFLTVLINFIIIAFALFLVVKLINKLYKPETAASAAPPADVVLLTEIRDLLKT
jgi:large conductance mechanosensitive channel